MIKEHISYSEIKTWKECSYKHKLVYIDKIGKTSGNIHTSAGKAIHSTCEALVKKEITEEQAADFVKKTFEKNLLEVEDTVEQTSIEEFTQQLIILSSKIIPSIKKRFGEDVIFLQAEESLYEDFSKETTNSINKFKGFIDLILKTSDGKIHIVDLKLSSCGWDAKKKSDPLVTYQLTFYKHFYAQKHGIDPKNIETYFAILKRTAKKNHVEIFRVTSGKKKTENAFNMLNGALYNIGKRNFIKNRTACTYCEFRKTKECP